ncbi:helix-turn-helix domain-containing protein [Micromonospora sp. SL1-18]|uniref:helix-turn-helix domain-containing protein n=1 Tax=Micromonospora sp. SL1-18 TaxID=3399128 RepID=UPI003A4E0017
MTTIRERYEEPLSLDDLARTATLSKFHFLRTFRDVTGVTPVRFLSAVRLQAAKSLLLSTSLDVADVSIQVGYGSLGTFTRRFTECVGISPTQYRRLARGETVPMPEVITRRRPTTQAGTISGTVHTVGTAASSTVFLGAFPTRIPQGRPVACTAVNRHCPWRMTAVPSGSWYLLAVAVDQTPTDTPPDPADLPLLVGTAGPVHVAAGVQAHVDVTIRPLDWRHPPMLFALPGVEALRHAA